MEALLQNEELIPKIFILL